jgi:hypothetical protein
MFLDERQRGPNAVAEPAVQISTIASTSKHVAPYAWSGLRQSGAVGDPTYPQWPPAAYFESGIDVTIVRRM